MGFILNLAIHILWKPIAWDVHLTAPSAWPGGDTWSEQGRRWVVR